MPPNPYRSIEESFSWTFQLATPPRSAVPQTRGYQPPISTMPYKPYICISARGIFGRGSEGHHLRGSTKDNEGSVSSMIYKDIISLPRNSLQAHPFVRACGHSLIQILMIAGWQQCHGQADDHGAGGVGCRF